MTLNSPLKKGDDSQKDTSRRPSQKNSSKPQLTLPVKISWLSQLRLYIQHKLLKTNLIMLSQYLSKPLVLIAVFSSLISTYYLVSTYIKASPSLPSKVYFLTIFQDISRGFLPASFIPFLIIGSFAIQMIIYFFCLNLFKRGYNYLYSFIIAINLLINLIFFLQLNTNLSRLIV